MLIAYLNPQGNFDPNDSYWTEHPDFGGQLVYVKEVAIAMTQLGHRVDIITRQIIDPNWPEFADPIDTYPDTKNIRILRFPAGPKEFLPKEQLWPYIREWVDNIVEHYEAIGEFPSAFTTHYADGGLAGVLLASLTGIPFTFTGHSLGAQKMDKLNVSRENIVDMENRYKFSKRIYAERLSMNHADQIITSTQQERMEQYGHHAYRGAIDPTDASRFTVIPPGVNRRIFNPVPKSEDEIIQDRIQLAIARDIDRHRADKPIVFASSRLDPKKNHIGLVQAFAVSNELKEHANLAIAVRGVENPLKDYASMSEEEQVILKQILAIMDESDLHGKVTGVALNSQQELAAAYRVLSRKNSIFALTALYEPFGLAPLEAMSCGLPAVVTKNGGPSESLIDGGTQYGMLVDPSDPHDIAAGILKVISTPENWKYFHKAGIKRVIDKYTWDKTAGSYLEVIEKITASGARGGTLPVPQYFQKPGSAEDIGVNTLIDIYF